MCFVSWCSIFGQEFLAKTTPGIDALWGVRLDPGDFMTHNLSQSTTVLKTMLCKHIVASTKRLSFFHYSDIISELPRINSRAIQLFVPHFGTPHHWSASPIMKTLKFVPEGLFDKYQHWSRYQPLRGDKSLLKSMMTPIHRRIHILPIGIFIHDTSYTTITRYELPTCDICHRKQRNKVGQITRCSYRLLYQFAQMPCDFFNLIVVQWRHMAPPNFANTDSGDGLCNNNNEPLPEPMLA